MKVKFFKLLLYLYILLKIISGIDIQYCIPEESSQAQQLVTNKKEIFVAYNS